MIIKNLIATLSLYFMVLSSPVMSESFGTFLDPLKVEMLNDGRMLQLLADYRYRDPQNRVWTTPAGWKIDGASIPQIFWSLIGGPLEGPYRNASVIHDYYCDTKQTTWQATHLVFYYGMRAAGVSEIKAEVMYYAVYKYGPRWDFITKTVCDSGGKLGCSSVKSLEASYAVVGPSQRDDVAAFQRLLEEKGPISLAEVRQRANSGEVQRLSAPIQ